MSRRRCAPDHLLACFIEDAVSLRLLDLIGSDIVCLEVDYPHSDSTWPHSPERLVRTLGDLDSDTVDAITHRNAMRHFVFGPLSILPPTPRPHRGQESPDSHLINVR